jgi:hypothetical protein
MAREGNMNRKILKDQSIKLFMHFDDNSKEGDEEAFTNLFFDLAEKEHKPVTRFIDPIYEQLGGDKGTDFENILGDFQRAIVGIAFSFGFVMGQGFDVPQSEFQGYIKAIKQVIRAKGLLPYLPRERKVV